ncbi:unnamed protein product [Debaryomyces tyrocola]|nr:unnamed protein product [Debaryomyces tyrocola]
MFANQLRSNITKSINMSSKRLSSSIVPVKTANAPPPAASYSQAIKVNGMYFIVLKDDTPTWS